MILRRKRRTRGAAYAEAVIMLPAFLLILYGNFVLYGAHQARGQSAEEARTEAWELSMEGCPLTGDDPVCTACGSHGDDVMGAFSGSGDGNWITRILGGLFGPVMTGRGTATYEGSGLLAGGSATSQMSLVCNTKRQTLMEVVKDALCSASIFRAIASFMGGFCS